MSRVRRALLRVLRALTAFGSIGVFMLVPPCAGWDGRWSAEHDAPDVAPDPTSDDIAGDIADLTATGLPRRRRRLRGPSAGHPERLCRDVPLTATEAVLAEQLAELAALWPESTY